MLDTILQFIKTSPELIGTVISLLTAHLGASAYVASTTTKATKVYKIVEAVALVIGKAKSKTK